MAQLGSGERRTRFQEAHFSPHDKIDGQGVKASRHHSISDEPGDVVVDEEATTDCAAVLVACGRADEDEEDDGESDGEDGADGVEPEVELLVVDLAGGEFEVADPAEAPGRIRPRHHEFPIERAEESPFDSKPVRRR